MEKDFDWFNDMVSVISLPGMRAVYSDAERQPTHYGFPLIMIFYRERDPLILEVDNNGHFHDPRKDTCFLGFDGAGIS